MQGFILITALGLFFVFEGILPFLSPRIWRWMLQQVFIQSDRSIRVMGLSSMLFGLSLVIIARQLF